MRNLCALMNKAARLVYSKTYNRVPDPKDDWWWGLSIYYYYLHSAFLHYCDIKVTLLWL